MRTGGGGRLAGVGPLMLLLDTHALVWLASDQEQITDRGQAMIRESAGRLFM